MWGLALLLAACSADPGLTVARSSDYPAYGSAEASLFNDSFAPGVVADLPETAPNWLAERVRLADVGVRAKIVTVAHDTVTGAEPSYRLQLRPLEPPFIGRLAEGELSLLVDFRSPAYAHLHASAGSLAGTAVIVLFKRYNEDGRVTLHFRVEPDDPELRERIQALSLLRDKS